MEHPCENCGKVITIPDNKVPKGKSFTIGCPHCKHKNKITPGEAPQNPDPKSNAGDEAPPEKPTKKGAKGKPDRSRGGGDENGSPDPESDRPFEFLEEGAETALICENIEDVRSKIEGILAKLGFYISSPKQPRDALKQMRFHDFDLIVLNERFGTRDPDMNHVLKFIEQVHMAVRRNMFVVLLSERFSTMDNMVAFNKSVNIVVNLNMIDQFDQILKKGLSDNSTFYRVYKESLIKYGKQ